MTKRINWRAVANEYAKEIVRAAKGPDSAHWKALGADWLESVVDKHSDGNAPARSLPSMVFEFGVNAGHWFNWSSSAPGFSDEDEVNQLRIRLIEEEAAETVAAFMDGNFVEVVDGCIDLIYVAIGALFAWNVPVEAVFAEVHRANMDKIGGPVREDGKQLKPEGWVPPNVEGILRNHGWEPSPQEADPVPASELVRDILSLVVEEEIPIEEIEEWSEEERIRAVNWAGAIHISASDHDDVAIPKRPKCLDRWAKWG